MAATSIARRIRQIHAIMFLAFIVAISLKDLSGNLLLDEDGLSLMYGAATLPFETFKYNFSVQPLVFYIGRAVYILSGNSTTPLVCLQHSLQL